MNKIPTLLTVWCFVLGLGCNVPLKENYDNTVKQSKSPEGPVGSEMPIATPKDLEHSFILYRDSVVTRIHNRQSSLPYDSVGVYMMEHRTELGWRPLNIVVTREATQGNVVDILDRISMQQVKAYALLRHP